MSNVPQPAETALPPAPVEEGFSREDILSSIRPGEIQLPKYKVNKDVLVFVGEGVPPTPKLRGSILKVTNLKAWWEKPYSGGSGEIPDCFAVNSVGPDEKSRNPQSDLCTTCRWDQFGSRRSAGGGATEGKDCTDRKRILFLPEGHLVPWVVDISSMGVKAVSKFLVTYFSALSNPAIELAKVEISLEKVTARSGMTSAAPKFQVLGFVTDPAEKAQLLRVKAMFLAQSNAPTAFEREPPASSRHHGNQVSKAEEEGWEGEADPGEDVPF